MCCFDWPVAGVRNIALHKRFQFVFHCCTVCCGAVMRCGAVNLLMRCIQLSILTLTRWNSWKFLHARSWVCAVRRSVPRGCWAERKLKLLLSFHRCALLAACVSIFIPWGCAFWGFCTVFRTRGDRALFHIVTVVASFLHMFLCINHYVLSILFGVAAG